MINATSMSMSRRRFLTNLCKVRRRTKRPVRPKMPVKTALDFLDLKRFVRQKESDCSVLHPGFLLQHELRQVDVLRQRACTQLSVHEVLHSQKDFGVWWVHAIVVIAEPLLEPCTVVIRVGADSLAPRSQITFEHGSCLFQLLIDSKEATQPRRELLMNRFVLPKVRVDRDAFKDVVKELVLRFQLVEHRLRCVNDFRLCNRAVQIAPRNRINLRVISDDLAAFDENVQVLNDSSALACRDLSNPPVALVVNFDEEERVTVVMFRLNTLFLLNIV